LDDSSSGTGHGWTLAQAEEIYTMVNDQLSPERMSKEITQHFADIAHLRGQVAYLEAQNANLCDVLSEIQRMRGAADGWLDTEITKAIRAYSAQYRAQADVLPRSV
jgi:hypothetical protein